MIQRNFVKKRKTVGETSLEAAANSTKYDPLEIGYAITDDVGEQIQICINNHYNIIDEPEFCVILLFATDPLIAGVVRKKFYAWPYLPKPRPWQSVFLYNKISNTLRRLWTLPRAEHMAVLSEEGSVRKEYQNMKNWSDAFYSGNFHNYIRRTNNITLETEGEYLEKHREELINHGGQMAQSGVPESFDFTKISANKFINSNNPIVSQDCIDCLGQT